ncbi:MAG: hypothetical protein QM668_13175 [Agriterribacter sp.]
MNKRQREGAGDIIVKHEKTLKNQATAPCPLPRHLHGVFGLAGKENSIRMEKSE